MASTKWNLPPLRNRGVNLALSIPASLFQWQFGSAFPVSQIQTALFDFLHYKCSMHSWGDQLISADNYAHQNIKLVNGYTCLFTAAGRIDYLFLVPHLAKYWKGRSFYRSHIKKKIKMFWFIFWKRDMCNSFTSNFYKINSKFCSKNILFSWF